jgi:hypothetical protein
MNISNVNIFSFDGSFVSKQTIPLTGMDILMAVTADTVPAA